MSSPMFLLTDDAIRAALTPAPELLAPQGLADDIRLAIEPVAQRSSGRLGWRPSHEVRLVLRVALAVALLLLLVAALLVVGSRLSPAIVSTYHGGPERTGIMPGPAPQGWPQVEEPTVSLNGPFGPWGPVVVNGLVLTGNQRGFVAAYELASRDPAWAAVDLGAPINSGLSVAGDLVLVGDDAGVLHALQVKDGMQVWSWHAPSGQPIHSSAAVIGDVAVVGSLGGDLVALDVADGLPRWTAKVGGQISRAIAAADGVAYVGVGGVTPEAPGTLQAWDIGNRETPVGLTDAARQHVNADGQRRPRVRGRRPGRAVHRPACPLRVRCRRPATRRGRHPGVRAPARTCYIDAVADGLVVVGSSDGQLVALDAATGTVRWGRARRRCGRVPERGRRRQHALRDRRRATSHGRRLAHRHTDLVHQGQRRPERAFDRRRPASWSTRPSASWSGSVVVGRSRLPPTRQAAAEAACRSGDLRRRHSTGSRQLASGDGSIASYAGLSGWNSGASRSIGSPGMPVWNDRPPRQTCGT